MPERRPADLDFNAYSGILRPGSAGFSNPVKQL